MSWFTDRPRVDPAMTARPWLPRSLSVGAEASPADEPPVPPLAFGEGEMARVAAAVVLRARREATAACAADPATRLAAALELMSEALAEANRRQVQEDAASMRRTLELAAAIARAAGLNGGGSHVLTDLVESMVAGWDRPGPVQLRLAPNLAAALHPLLPEVSARAGVSGSIELEPDPGLPEGAMRLHWPGGWLEHDPPALAARVAELLAAHAIQDRHPAIPGHTDEHDPA